MVLLQHFHGHAVPEVVRLQLGAADKPAVHLAEAPDVLACHRGPGFADAAPTPGGPEQWDLRAHVLDLRAEHRSTYACRNCMTAEGRGISRVLPPLTRTPRRPQVPSRCWTRNVATDSRRIPV